MKRILKTTGVSLLISVKILLILTAFKGYLKPIQSLTVVTLLHVPILLFTLMELKKSKTANILPSTLGFITFCLFSYLTYMPIEKENDFYLIPLSIGISQFFVLIWKI